MRLGDLDALRKNMEFICMGIMAGTEPYNAPLTEIDNAPTVEPYCYFCGQKEHGIRPQITVCCENADEKTIEELKAELERVINEGRPQGEQIAWEQGYECGKNESRPQGEWIPVSERLPKENGEYLVTREAYIDRENRNMIFVRDIAWFTTNYELNNGFHKANTVIAWMPLPERYEPKEVQ